MVISSVDLPEPDGPDEADRLAAPDLERDALEDVHPRGAAPEAQIHILQRDGLVLHRQRPDLSAWKLRAPPQPPAAHMGILRMKRQPGSLVTFIFACAVALRWRCRGRGAAGRRAGRPDPRSWPSATA